jgi:hypothetical protein
VLRTDNDEEMVKVLEDKYISVGDPYGIAMAKSDG